MVDTGSPAPAAPAWLRGAFDDAHPEYAKTARIDELRVSDYAYLDAEQHVYLDYGGAGLPSASQLRSHADRITAGCFGNPHSDSPSSMASTVLVEQARSAVHRFFRADPDEYAVIFTANATGACRLVGEAYPFGPDRRFLLAFDNHNSVNGIREFARHRGGAVEYVPLLPDSLRIDEAALGAALSGPGGGLLAFPAQSNFTGVQHPFALIDLAHEHGYDVLLDAAAFVPTNVLDLSAVKPDFVPVSWYKVFGYPTGVGCLLARRDALARLCRPWFSGGTIQAVSARGDWYVLTSDESAYEDGTLSFLTIPDVGVGIDWLTDIGQDVVHERVGLLAGWLLDQLGQLRHGNGAPMIRVYGPATMDGRGGTVAFNFLDPAGEVVDERIVSRDAAAAMISLRTGCFCNPGAGEGAFAIPDEALIGAVSDGMDTLDDYLTELGLPSGGAIRVSLGLASTVEDVHRFLAFAQATYADAFPSSAGLNPRLRC
jgi:selenocysteine lyase/cysteine desulfurase